jgi:hypothetical protein
MVVLQNDMKLVIEDFGKNANLNEKIQTYYRLLQDYMGRRNHSLVFHVPDRYIGS